ncbi:MAG: AAA family ATPase, partial [bacterium]
MITELHVENLAIIQKASVSFRDGFTALTGETGAGKSLLIDALELCLGERADTELVRTGATKASVQLVVDLSQNQSILRATCLLNRGKKRLRQRTLDDLEDAAEASLTHQLEKKRSLSDWAEGALRILATIYRDRELHSDSEADRGIVACVTRLQELNEKLRRIPASVLPACTASQALQLLLRQIGETSIPPEANDQAVELLGWLELTLDDSPVLVLTGFNEGKIPESINADAFMPNSLRTRLELTDNRRRYARDAYALTSVLHSRRRVIVITGRTDVK